MKPGYRYTEEGSSFSFADPAKYYELKESRSCQGCAHVCVAFDTRYCGKGKKYGSKCKQYQEMMAA
jgi:hypothetical protein